MASVAGIGERFAGHPALVVVDHLEHLDRVGAVLADLLTRLPTMRVLATGRSPAGVAGGAGVPSLRPDHIDDRPHQESFIRWR